MAGKVITYILVCFSGSLTLVTVLLMWPELVNGMVVGQQIWFQWISMLFVGSVAFMWFFNKSKIDFNFTLPDFLVLLLGGVVLYSYNWELTPAYSRFVFTLQLLPFWFSLRLAFFSNPKLRYIFILGLIVTGFIEAIWGFRQLYGFTYSNHQVFRLTGSFYNPGPYSGYLAVILPVTLDIALKYRDYSRIWPFDIKNLLFWFSVITFVIVITILPAGMSRTAWIAAGISCALIFWIRLSGKEIFFDLWKKYHRYRILAIFCFMLLLICGGIGVYMLKKDSANGRLLIWKIAVISITDNPIMGTGLGGFAVPYASSQEAYFASGEATDSEKLVAGTPDYLFNEYIQLILEQGLIGFLCFVLLISFCLYRGLRNKQTTACGGLIALCVFAFSSYPLQLPSFCIVLTILLAICLIPKGAIVQVTIPDHMRSQIRTCLTRLLILIICGASLNIYLLQKDIYFKHKEWSKIKKLHKIKAYEQAVKAYEKLYPILGYEPAFLFEFAQCLSNQREYEFSNLYLEKATNLKVDPMIYNVMAKNYQAIGKFNEAERCLWKSINLLPERLYPYYLLTKLYSDPRNNKPQKAKDMAEIVLTKEPKVHSRATYEMREEILKMYKTQ